MLLDGEDIRNLKLQSLKKPDRNCNSRMCICLQEPLWKISGTETGRLQMKKSFAPQRQPMPMNLFTELEQVVHGYRTAGVKLSGGQKQRLSIARVF